VATAANCATDDSRVRGAITLLSVVLAATFSVWFLLLAAFVGVNQWLYVVVGNCPASLVLHRLGVPAECSPVA
jgi:hypothetical protein